MINWLFCQEKISFFETYLEGLDSHFNPNAPAPPTQLSQCQMHKIAEFPPFPAKCLTSIQHQHQAPNFTKDLKEYLNNLVSWHPVPNHHASLFTLPFQHVDVYSQFKFHPHSLVELIAEEEEDDNVKALPISAQNPSGQFDMVVVLNNDEAESAGLMGELS